MRKRWFSDETIERLAEERTAHEDTLSRQREALAVCVEKLDADSRELLESRYASGIALRQFAEQHGKSANALYLTMHRIRLRLVECVNRTLKLEGWT
jgi:RNA polymerase sigma-70 factor (ECF subfamily)